MLRHLSMVSLAFLEMICVGPRESSIRKAFQRSSCTFGAELPVAVTMDVVEPCSGIQLALVRSHD